jgi:hypothetical protein
VPAKPALEIPAVHDSEHEYDTLVIEDVEHNSVIAGTKAEESVMAPMNHLERLAPA